MSATDPAPVSAIVPCWKSDATLARALRSVAAQTRRPAELLLVDDGNPPGSRALLHRLRDELGGDWVRVVTLERNRGPAAARNAGWNAALQPYVAFLDADDVWHPRKIEIQAGWLAAHADTALCAHRYAVLRPGEDALAEAPVMADGSDCAVRALTARSLLVSNRISTPCVMLRREITLRFPEAQRHAEDWHLWLELALSGARLALLDVALAFGFKPVYGAGGLSGQLWRMQAGETRTLWTLWRHGRLGLPAAAAGAALSWAKFARRLVRSAAGAGPPRRVSPPARTDAP